MGDRRRWLLVVGLIPAVLVLLPRIPAMVWADRLPDPVAVDFSISGAPQGSMSLWGNELFSAGLAILAWGFGAVMVRNSRAWRVRRSVASFTVATVGFLALVGIAVVGANLDATSWQQARLPGWLVIAAFLGAAALGYLAWALCGTPPVGDVEGAPLSGDLPSAGAGHDTVWVGSSSNRWLALLGVVLGGGMMLLAPLVSWWLLLAAAAVLLACVTVAVLQARCDATGLTVRYGLLGWPVQRIPMAEIESAHVVDLDPMEWGGWGYRWSPQQNGAAAVTRRGPAIVVQRVDGRRFAVTVDDAATGAGVLNDLRN